MRRLLTPPVVLLAGLALTLAGCSGESPTSPTGAGGGSGSGTCNVTISLDATSVTPLAGTYVIVRATVKKSGVAVPDGSSVVFTTDFGVFVDSGLPSISKVTTSGFADVSFGSMTSGTAHVKATFECGSATIAVQFAAIPVDGPYISSITPLTGSCKGGDTVTINGGRFMTSLNIQPRVTFGGAPATILSASASVITVLTPARTLADASVPETVDVVVTVNPGTASVQTTAPKKFTYTCLDKRVAVTSVVPNNGRQEGNEPVVVNGANFGLNAATTRVTFGGVSAPIYGQSDSAINVTTPRHMLANPAVPEVVDVGVTVDLGLVTQQSALLPRAFTYYATGAGAPCNSDPRLYITQVTVTTPTASPGSPDGGDVVTISGLGFWFGNSAQPQPMSRLKVEFGGVQAVVSTWTDSSIVAVAPRFTLTNPDAPQSVEVKVTVDVGGFREACATSARAYTYFPGSFADIYITSMSPSTGPNDASTRVTIFGKNFRFPSQVFVSGGTIVNAEATVVSITSSQIVFMTPLASGANAGLAGSSATVTVRDTYSGKTVTSPVPFRYYPCPTAGTASPATTPWNVSTPVTISGNAFEEPVNAVFVAPGGQTLQLNVISVSSGFIVIQMPTLDQLLGTGNLAPCADVNGTIKLTFPSLVCAGTISVPFTYQINRPTISTVSPPTIPQNPVSVTVSVTGSNFVDPMTVEILKDATVVATVNNAVVSSTSSLTFLAPPINDSAFNTNSCSASGTQRVPTSFGVRLTNQRTGCTATLPNALVYTPADTTCSTKLLLPAASLPDASLCTSYSPSPPYKFVANGGVGALSWAATGLPAGMSLSPSGVLSGTPQLSANGPGQASALVTINVTVTDSSPTPQTATRAFQFSLSDLDAPLAITGATPQNISAAGGTTSAFTASPNPTPSAPFSFTPLTWSITSIVPTPASGSITLTSPTGQTNTLTVTSTVPAGSYTVNLQVTDNACGPFKHQSVILPVTIVKAVPAGPTITSAAAVNATICTALNFPFAATGGTGPTYTWAVSSGSLPSGFVLSPGGVLSGTPQLTTTTSPYPFTSSSSFSVTVSDSAVPPLMATQVVTLTITDPMAPFNILGPTNIAVPAAGGETNAVGSPALPFTVNPPPVAGFIPVTWTVGVATGVPPTVNPPAGSFSITDPTRTNQSIFVSPALAAGTYEMTLTAVDNTCGTLKHKADLVVRITKLPAPPAALASGYAGGLPNGTVCKVYSKAPTTTGGTGTYSYSLVASSLPQGLSLDPTTGVVSGAPAILATGPGTPSQSYTVTIRVTDSAVPTPQTVTNTYTFSVGDPAALFPVIGPTPVAPSASALVPTPYTYNLSLPSVPENLPYTWSIVSVMAVGAAPPAPAGAFTLTPSGVSNSTSAVLAVAGGGVLASPNSYDVTIQVRDNGCAGAGNYHVNTIVVRVNVAP